MSRRLSFDPIAEARRQWCAHGWEEAAAGMAAVTSVMRAQQIFLGKVDRALAPFELTFARFEVLTLLSFSRRGSMPMGALGARLQVAPGSVTNAVDRLERQGLVQRVPHPTDGRATLAEITPAGRAVAAEAVTVLNREVFTALGVDDRDLEGLFDVLRRIREHADHFLQR